MKVNKTPAWLLLFPAILAIGFFSGDCALASGQNLSKHEHETITQRLIVSVDHKIPPLNQMDDIIAYFDPSYKPKTTNDFKAIKVWGKKGLNLYCIDAFVKQTSITEAVKWFYDLHESLPQNVIMDYYMEEVFLQDMFYEDFAIEARNRGYYLPIRGDKRDKGDKFARIQAIAALWERGLVTYNIDKRNSQHMISGIEQTLAFQKGASIHDDGPGFQSFNPAYS